MSRDVHSREVGRRRLAEREFLPILDGLGVKTFKDLKGKVGAELPPIVAIASSRTLRRARALLRCHATPCHATNVPGAAAFPTVVLVKMAAKCTPRLPACGPLIRRVVELKPGVTTQMITLVRRVRAILHAFTLSGRVNAADGQHQ